MTPGSGRDQHPQADLPQAWDTVQTRRPRDPNPEETGPTCLQVPAGLLRGNHLQQLHTEGVEPSRRVRWLKVDESFKAVVTCVMDI